MTKRTCLILLLLLGVPAALMAADAAAASNAAATIGKEVITQDELSRAAANRLMRVRTDEYNIRRNVLDEIIGERLLAQEAARRHLTVAELLKSEVESKVFNATAADIEPFYEAMKERFGSTSKADAMQEIAANMRQQSVERRRKEFVDSLRASAGVKVLLAPPRAEVQAVGPSRGSITAPVTIVEFSDFECPFCSRASATMKKIEESYGSRVRIVFRDFPLASHRGAPRAAEAAHCAEEQGKFWEMHDRLYSKGGGTLTDADLRRFAGEAGLDGQKFGTCLDSGKYTETWKTSQAEGMRIGVGSTPTFFINGRMIPGAAPYEIFAAMIDEELDHAGGGHGASTVVAERAH